MSGNHKRKIRSIYEDRMYRSFDALVYVFRSLGVSKKPEPVVPVKNIAQWLAMPLVSSDYDTSSYISRMYELKRTGRLTSK